MNAENSEVLSEFAGVWDLWLSEISILIVRYRGLLARLVSA